MNTIALTHPVKRAGAGVGRVAGVLWARWRHHRQSRETRHYLEQMDDHMLQDLGVSRAQAFFELDSVRRPDQAG